MISQPFHYYDVDGNIYISRIDAKKSGRPCNFYFHDDVFSKTDWTRCPTESLSALYRQRAQQIRDSYDRVVLCYSGGIDSTNVLESFYYNGLHIDEIFIMGPFSQDPERGSDIYHNGCAYHNAFPLLGRLDLPNTKISVIDHIDWLKDPHELTAVKRWGNEYYKFLGSRPSPHHLFWHDLDKVLGSKGKTAYVLGKEKPFLRYDPDVNRYYTHFGDISFVNYGNRYEYGEGSRVNFYTDPDAMDLMLKQLHIIKDWHHSTVIQQRKMSNDEFNRDYAPICKKLVYDLKNPLVYESPKTKSYYLAIRDEFLLEHTDSEIFKLYADSMRKLFDEIGRRDNFSFISRRYYLS